MMDLDRNVARSFFTKMVIYNNIVIIETITSDNFCPLMNLLINLEIFNMEESKMNNGASNPGYGYSSYR